jgi:hypothetical protein
MPGYKCKICSDFKVIGGYQQSRLDIERHFINIHHTEIFPGDVEYIEAKPRKLWTCPVCKEKMSYHSKYFHQQNATKKGEPYMCVPKV